MRTKKDIIQKRIYNELAIKYKLTSQEVEDIFYGIFKFIKDNVEELDLKSVNSMEDMENLKCNFNLPRFSKVYLNKQQVLKYNKKKDE